MTVTGALDRGRAAFENRSWASAYEQLTAAHAESPLGAEDLERLAMAAYLTGEDTDSVDMWSRAHHAFLGEGAAERAVRCAFWLGMSLMMRGETAPGGGWLARAQRILDEGRHDCVERGYLLIPLALQRMGEGDAPGGHATFLEAEETAKRFGNPDLLTFARLGRGQALIEQGRITEGLRLLDEAMVAVTAGEVSAAVAGIVYCAVLLECQKVSDLRRAQEWTTALTRWCESQPGLVLYRGQCLVHRSELFQLHGAWPDALEEARRACERLSRPPQPAVGMAYYQLAELHRLRGELSRAEEAYRQATEWGRDPQPGLAQLRLAQGRADTASATIRRVVGETHDPPTRSRMLPAYIEIMLAAGDVPAAREGADELGALAPALGTPLVHALALQMRGAVLLAEGDERAAYDVLRKAWRAWEDIDAPYDTARVRVLIARACRKLGDPDTADLELDAARRAFRQLGARPDLAGIEELSGRAPATAGGVLTAREVEVLGLVAAGKTNRRIAAELVISEKTVARHISNIFTKLGVSTRSAATAYSYEHELTRGSPE